VVLLLCGWIDISIDLRFLINESGLASMGELTGLRIVWSWWQSCVVMEAHSRIRRLCSYQWFASLGTRRSYCRGGSSARWWENNEVELERRMGAAVNVQ
jgi:hypothetical protein